jgi:hypothetical protein
MERNYATMLLVPEVGTFVSSFAHGTRRVHPRPRPQGETEIWARVQWLAGHGRIEEAEELLEEWCLRR